MSKVDRYMLLMLWSLAFVPLAGRLAHGQTSGYSVAPDGTVTSWSNGSGYQVGPGGTSSWSPDGGYAVTPGGGVSSWTGPVEPVVPSETPQFVVPGESPDPLPPLE